MPLLKNLKSGRDLREGDVVRTKDGAFGRIVAFDLFEAEPVIVIDNSGELRSTDANDVELIDEGPSGLEPLPPIVSMLNEGKVEESIRTCSGAICLRLHETHETLTLIPKNTSNLRESFTVLCEDMPFSEAIKELLKESHVTRLPHLIESPTSKMINDLLEKDTEQAIDFLLKESE